MWCGHYPVLLLPGAIGSVAQVELGKQWLDEAAKGADSAVVFLPDRAHLHTSSAISAVFGEDFAVRAATSHVAKAGSQRVLVATTRRLRSHRRAWPVAPTLALWPSMDDLRLIDHCIRPTSLAIAVGEIAALATWIETRRAPPFLPAVPRHA